ncbi:MAG: hypothetical protein IJH71_08000 [Eubacterium sp.]|nr:hypothetical protein [Eubacterium sp.]
MKDRSGNRADRWKKYVDTVLAPWMERLSIQYRRTYVETSEDTERRSRRFLRQMTIWAGGSLVILLLTAGLMMACAWGRRDVIRLRRNAFGEGEKEETLILSDHDRKTGRTKTYRLILEEQTLSRKELEKVYKDLFSKLETVMAGDNRSLLSVNRDLYFPQSLPGYPFTLSYETEDADYITADGSLSEPAGEILPGQKKETWVTVTALYVSGSRRFSKSRTYPVFLTAPGSYGSKSPWSGTIRKLRMLEKESRDAKELEIPARIKGISIRRPESGSGKPLPVMIMILAAVPIRRLLKIREERSRCQKEAVRDFAMIVHLFTIYQRAGLSFTNALAGINRDYCDRIRKKGSRYAFERLIQMEVHISRGMPAARACRIWGSQFDDPCFRKLSRLLIQSMEKGASEAGAMMEEEEKEAFSRRIDQAKKEGEEASTKMLLPMILMLMQVMLLAIYPALVRFYSF